MLERLSPAGSTETGGLEARIGAQLKAIADPYRDHRGRIGLFSGTDGTGKAIAARVLGDRLGYDVYRVDLSTVVSKYIGETEKNLSGILEAAGKPEVILFFDEADALFGKRGDASDAHDRYANRETNYFLERLEGFGGLVILATDTRANLDEAWLRRLDWTVDFPPPGSARPASLPERIRRWLRRA